MSRPKLRGRPPGSARHDPKSRTPSRPSAVSRKFPGCGSVCSRPQRFGPAEQEPLVELPQPIALRLRSRRRHPGERDAVQPRLHENPRGGQHDAGHDGLRIVRRVRGRERPLVRGLPAVVELLEQPGPQLRDQRRHGDAARHQGGDARGQREGPDVGEDRLPHPRVLDLDGDLPAVGQDRAMHLPDGRRGRRALVEGGEPRPPLRSEFGDEHALGVRPRHAGVGLLQRGQRLTPALLGVGGEQRLHGRQQLAGLERAALELAEHAPGTGNRARPLSAGDLRAVAPQAAQHQPLDAESGGPERQRDEPEGADEGHSPIVRRLRRAAA